MIKILATACLWLTVPAAWAQPQPPDANYQLGKPFTASLQVPAGVAKGVLPGDTLGGFEVLLINDSAQNNAGYLEVMLLPTDTGRQLLPLSWHAMPAQRQYRQVQVSLPPNAALLQYQPPLEIVDLYPDEPATTNRILWWIALAALLLALAGWLWWRRIKPKHALNLGLAWHPGELLQQTRQQWQAGTLTSMQLGQNLIKVMHFTVGARQELTVSRLAVQLLRNLPEGLAAQQVEIMLAETDAWRFGRQVATPGGGMQYIDITEYLLLAKGAAKPNAE
jgi:hypothetical protein